MSLSVAMVAMPRRIGGVSLKVFAIMGASMAPMMGLLMNLVKLKPSYGASLIAPPMATSRPLTAPMAASLSILFLSLSGGVKKFGIKKFLFGVEVLGITMFYGRVRITPVEETGAMGASDSKEVLRSSQEVLMLV